MTPEDQDRLISDMVKERNALRRENTLLNELVTQTQQGMQDARGAANLTEQGNSSALARGFDYQSADDFADTLRRRETVRARLAELNERLDACC